MSDTFPAPCCRQCSKRLKPLYKWNTVRVPLPNDAGFTSREERGELRGWGYAGRNHFCSLRCGWRFAVDAVENNPGTPGASCTPRD